MRSLALVLVSLAPLLSLSQQRAQTTADSAARVEPFYIEKTVSTFDTGGKLSRKEIIARRSDGVVVRINTVGPSGSPYFARQVIYPDGHSIRFFDILKTKSTFPLRDENEASRSRALSSTPDCGVAPPYKLLDRTSFMEQPIVVLQSEVSERYRLTRWLAVRLGCQAVYYKSEVRNSDGTFTLSAEAKTDRLLTEEPDPKLFDTGDDYEEMRPSEAQRRMLQKMDLKLSTVELEQVQREGERADALYERARKR